MFGSTAVAGLTTGATYALIGMGFVILFRSTGVVSFAQGFYSVLGALTFGSFANDGAGLALSILGSVGITGIVGGLTYLVVFARLSSAKPFVLSIASVGLGFGLEAVAVLIWGATPIITPQLLGFEHLGTVSWFPITPVGVFTLASAAVVAVALGVGLRTTAVGLRMRAVADNARLAAAQGISVVRIGTLAWLLAAGTAALAGIVLTLGTQPDPPSLFNLGLVAFPAILLGGIDSLGGVVLGGLLIGMVQAVVSSYWSAQYSDVSAYAVLLAVLLLRPQGIFGSNRAIRV